MKQLLLVFLGIFLFHSSESLAQTKDSIVPHRNELLFEKFVISAGAFIPAKELTMGVNGGTPNDLIDFGKDLGFDDSDVTFTFNFFWRFSKSRNWSVAIEYFSTDNTRNQYLDREIDWGDTTYPVGTKVSTNFKLALYRVLFGRVVTKGKKHELIVGVGIHALDISSHMQALGYAGETDFGVEKDFDLKRVSLLAPVPNLGLKFLYAPTPKWGLGARIDYFSLNTGKFDGYLWNISPSVSYQLFDFAGIGASYRYFNTSLDVHKRFWDGSVDLLYQGPLLFASFNF